MKKVLLLGAILVLMALVLSGCKAPEPEPTPSPEPTEAPTPFVPTPEPTVTPRPLDVEVEQPGPEETLIVLDPVDKPTRPPIVFEPYRTFSSAYLNISFEVPTYLGEPEGDEANSHTLVFKEPLSDIRSGTKIPAELSISVNQLSTEQTQRDAENALDQWLNDQRALFEGFETSSKAENSMLGEKGYYVTFWVDMPVPDGGEETESMRGRCLMVPKGTRLYMVYFLCPKEFNSQYETGLFKKVRASMEVL
ncbi:hypothetical protein LJC74_07255 [Eubacteriales bacterium OttesenSCG-928-A19]|nr:hypothetical protein [Eubacteriales bacterium OttesenSCG-928-A19]